MLDTFLSQPINNEKKGLKEEKIVPIPEINVKSS